MFSEHIRIRLQENILKIYILKNHGLFKTGENVQIVDIGKSDDGTEYCIAIRIESHNHPTFIDPFEVQQLALVEF